MFYCSKKVYITIVVILREVVCALQVVIYFVASASVQEKSKSEEGNPRSRMRWGKKRENAADKERVQNKLKMWT